MFTAHYLLLVLAVGSCAVAGRECEGGRLKDMVDTYGGVRTPDWNGCTIIKGDIDARMALKADFVYFSENNNVREVTGNVIIGHVPSFPRRWPGSNMTDWVMPGFEDLAVIGRDLVLSDVQVQITFPKLEVIKHDLSIGDYLNQYNVYGTSLDNLDGLSSLKEVGAKILIHSNAYLKSIKGLAGINKSVKGMKIVYNDVLENLEGLHNIIRVGWYSIPRKTGRGGNDHDMSLEISHNPKLRTLVGGFDSLRSAAIYIKENDALEDVTFPSLTSVIFLDDGGQSSTWGFSIDIQFNSNLNNLDGLASLKTQSDDYRVRISRNGAQCPEIHTFSEVSMLTSSPTIWSSTPIPTQKPSPSPKGGEDSGGENEGGEKGPEGNTDTVRIVGIAAGAAVLASAVGVFYMKRKRVAELGDAGDVAINSGLQFNIINPSKKLSGSKELENQV